MPRRTIRTRSVPAARRVGAQVNSPFLVDAYVAVAFERHEGTPYRAHEADRGAWPVRRFASSLESFLGALDFFLGAATAALAVEHRCQQAVMKSSVSGATRLYVAVASGGGGRCARGMLAIRFAFFAAGLSDLAGSAPRPTASTSAAGNRGTGQKCPPRVS